MNALVTGAAGFIGRNLIQSLLAEGWDVEGIDNFVTSDRHDLRQSGLVERGLRFTEGDVSEQPLWHSFAGRSLDIIYHLACPTGVPNLRPLALEMLAASYEGTRAALGLARACGARVVLASSAEVYGNPLVSPQAEEYCGNVDVLGPRNGYEEGKRVAEALCSIYHERFQVDAVIARIFNTYGPGMALTETRVVPAFVRAALEQRPLLVHGDGRQTRCHAYVDDIVLGLRALAERGAAGRAYNLGSTHPSSVVTLARTVRRLACSSSPIERIDRPAHDHDMRLPDISRASAELNWEPRTSIAAGLRATILDFRVRLGLYSDRDV